VGGWEEGKPASGDFAVGPGGGEVGAEAEDGVVVGSEDGVGADFDGEEGGEGAQPVDDPGFTVGEVALSEGIEAAEEGAADATGEAVVDAFLVILDVSASRQSHGSPPFDMSNWRPMEMIKKKFAEKWVSRFAGFPGDAGMRAGDFCGDGIGGFADHGPIVDHGIDDFLAVLERVAIDVGRV
jgi:hypothetical protein